MGRPLTWVAQFEWQGLVRSQAPHLLPADLSHFVVGRWPWLACQLVDRAVA